MEGFLEKGNLFPSVSGKRPEEKIRSQGAFQKSPV